MLHPFPFLSALAYLCGVACLAALCVHVQKKRLMAASAYPDCVASSRSRCCQLGEVFATACALASFLFMPTAAFPAYASSGASMPVWFVLVGAACAVAHTVTRRGVSSSGWTQFATPWMLGAVYAICVRYAYLRGFPGNFGDMESMMSVPLYSGAEPVQLAGLLCLAAATLLCAASLSARHDVPFFRACLQLATAQFTVCLFVPVGALRLVRLPSVPGLLAEYALHWGLTVVLVLAVYPAMARMYRFRRVAALLGMGAVLLLIFGR